MYFVFGIVSLSVLIFFSCCVYCEEKVIEKQRIVTVRSLLYTGTYQFWQAGFRLLLRYVALLLVFPDVTSPFTHSCFVIIPVSVHQEWYQINHKHNVDWVSRGHSYLVKILNSSTEFTIDKFCCSQLSDVIKLTLR